MLLVLVLFLPLLLLNDMPLLMACYTGRHAATSTTGPLLLAMSLLVLRLLPLLLLPVLGAASSATATATATADAAAADGKQMCSPAASYVEHVSGLYQLEEELRKDRARVETSPIRTHKLMRSTQPRTVGETTSNVSERVTTSASSTVHLLLWRQRPRGSSSVHVRLEAHLRSVVHQHPLSFFQGPVAYEPLALLSLREQEGGDRARPAAQNTGLEAHAMMILDLQQSSLSMKSRSWQAA